MKASFDIIKRKRVSSTNDLAKKLIQSESLNDFTVIAANEQLIGRGQKKNSWHSQSNKNLTISIITFPEFLKVTHQFYLSKMISLGILEYLKTKGKYFKIKWPNDIYYKDKKICGLLIENAISGSKLKNSVIGIGLNINQTDFPEDLSIASSLSIINRKEYLLDAELTVLLTYIYKFYTDLKKLNFEKTDKQYHKALYKINEFHSFKDSDGSFKGMIIGTMPEGKLLIQTSDKQLKSYNFKEIEFY